MSNYYFAVNNSSHNSNRNIKVDTPRKLPPFVSYDPVNSPTRDSQTLPTFEKHGYNKDVRRNDTTAGVVITNGLPVGKSLSEVEIFSHEHFNLLPHVDQGIYRGETMRSLRTTFDLNLTGHPLDQAASSIIVYSGYWKFYDWEGNELSPILGPGHYDQVSDIFGPDKNDAISRFESVKNEIQQM